MKNIKLTNYLILLAIGILFVPSCIYETIELGKCTNLNFADDIQAMFDSKCISCHSGSSAPAGLDLTPGNSYKNLKNGNYFDIDDPENSKLYIKAKGGHNGADACKILGWIEEGAEEGEKLIDSVKYNDDIQVFFYNYCMKCHVTGHTSGLDLTPNKSYASIESNELYNLSTPDESELYVKLNEGHGNAPAENISDILKWIEQGALEPDSDYPVINANYDDVQTIFNQYCVYCHYSTNQDGGINLTKDSAYQSIIDSNLVDTLNPASSLIYTTLINDHSDDATGIEYWKILTWIEDGASIDIPPVSFSSDIQPILTDNCMACHGSPSGSAGLDLSDGNAYASLQGNGTTSTINGTPFINTSDVESSGLIIMLIGTLHDGKVTADELNLIRKWIEEGALDNK